MKTSNSLLLLSATITAIAAFAVVPAAQADTYAVNRSFTDGLNTATLVGTVDVPLGNYTIMNGAPNPFTSVVLTLTVNGTPYALDHADTSLISGNGQFFVDATSSFLIFNTANADGGNPADLQFYPASNNDRYVIGSDGNPGFETGETSAGFVLGSVNFPVVFGTTVPETSTSSLVILGLSLLMLVVARQRFSRRQIKVG